MTSVLIIIPTYNEVQSLPTLVPRVLTEVPQGDVLIVDDASPDGTGELADDLAEQSSRVRVLHRAVKDGLGAAYRSGFAWGLARGYDLLVEMDADGSHSPEQLSELLQASQHADLVIGSRWVPGGRVVNWPGLRRIVSRGGTSYARVMLGLDVRDATAGFRVFRRAALREIDYASVASRGYCFQIDLTRRIAAAGLVIAEVPVTFVERTQGRSKMSAAIVAEALLRVTWWGARYRLGQLRGWLTGRPEPDEPGAESCPT